MIDVIVYKPSAYGLVFRHDKTLGLRPRVYHLSHQTWAGLCVLYHVCLNINLLSAGVSNGNLIGMLHDNVCKRRVTTEII